MVGGSKCSERAPLLASKGGRVGFGEDELVWCLLRAVEGFLFKGGAVLLKRIFVVSALGVLLKMICVGWLLALVKGLLLLWCGRFCSRLLRQIQVCLKDLLKGTNEAQIIEKKGWADHECA